MIPNPNNKKLMVSICAILLSFQFGVAANQRHNPQSGTESFSNFEKPTMSFQELITCILELPEHLKSKALEQLKVGANVVCHPPSAATSSNAVTYQGSNPFGFPSSEELRLHKDTMLRVKLFHELIRLRFDATHALEFLERLEWQRMMLGNEEMLANLRDLATVSEFYDLDYTGYLKEISAEKLDFQDALLSLESLAKHSIDGDPNLYSLPEYRLADGLMLLMLGIPEPLLVDELHNELNTNQQLAASSAGGAITGISNREKKCRNGCTSQFFFGILGNDEANILNDNRVGISKDPDPYQQARKDFIDTMLPVGVVAVGAGVGPLGVIIGGTVLITKESYEYNQCIERCKEDNLAPNQPDSTPVNSEGAGGATSPATDEPDEDGTEPSQTAAEENGSQDVKPKKRNEEENQEGNNSQEGDKEPEGETADGESEPHPQEEDETPELPDNDFDPDEYSGTGGQIADNPPSVAYHITAAINYAPCPPDSNEAHCYDGQTVKLIHKLYALAYYMEKKKPGNLLLPRILMELHLMEKKLTELCIAAECLPPIQLWVDETPPPPDWLNDPCIAAKCLQLIDFADNVEENPLTEEERFCIDKICLPTEIDGVEVPIVFKPVFHRDRKTTPSLRIEKILH